MNYKVGLGCMVSMFIYMFCEGVFYIVSCFLVDNFDGGLIYKIMCMEIKDIFGKRLGFKLEFFVVSNYSIMWINILWEIVVLNVCGIGKFVYLIVDFNMLGFYGLFVVDI